MTEHQKGIVVLPFPAPRHFKGIEVARFVFT